MFEITYRGYTIKWNSRSRCYEISQHGEVIDQSAHELSQAKMTVDGWLNADDGR